MPTMDLPGSVARGQAPGSTGEAVVASKKTLSDYKKMFDDYRSTSETNRTQALIDFDYYDGKQLTPNEVATLRARGQPDIVVNRVRVAVNGILGVVIQANTDPKAWPRNPQDDDAASAATDALRYVETKAGFRATKRMSWKDYLCGGTASVLVGIDKAKNVTITPIRWEEFFYDPRSRREDFKDARYMGIAKWMYSDDVDDKWPGKLVGGQDAVSGGPGMIDESYEDRPLNQGWLDSRNKRIMVVEMYHREGGKWFRCVFYYGGILEQGPSPYKDETGAACNPIVAQSCYVDRDNNRYGTVRDMRDLQDEINKRRSRLLFVVNSSQIQARDPSAIEVDSNAARLEAARPDGVLPFGWEKVSTQDMAQGQMLLLTEAKNEMERFGPNPAVLGRQGADTSGRALLARQQAGLIELAIILDQMDEWEERVYQASWGRCKQYWRDPQWLRITDDPENARFVGINQPIKEKVPMVNPVTGEPMMEGGMLDGNEQPQPMMMETGRILGYENNIAEMDVDIVIDVVPETASIMEEQVKALFELMQINPAYANQIPIEGIIDLMNIPRKRQLLGKIKALKETAGKAQAEEQAKQMEVALETAISKIEATRAQAALNNAKIPLTAAQTELAQAQAQEALSSANRNDTEAEIGVATALHDVVSSTEDAETKRSEAAKPAE